jgi:hypothetical protein
MEESWSYVDVMGLKTPTHEDEKEKFGSEYGPVQRF